MVAFTPYPPPPTAARPSPVGRGSPSVVLGCFHSQGKSEPWERRCLAPGWWELVAEPG